jgi:hypothetical protein
MVMRNFLFLILCLFINFGMKAQIPDSILNQYDRHWQMSLNVYRVMKNGNTGVVGPQGVLVPCEYQQVWSFNVPECYRVLQNGKAGLYHIEKGLIIPAEFDQIADSRDGRIKVLKSGKTGFYNCDGSVLIPAIYDQVGEMDAGLAKVFRNGRFGFVNAQGQEVIPCVYQHIWDFEGNMARVLRDGNQGFIHLDGREVVPTSYQHIWDFQDGRARVLKNGLIGFVDVQGQEVIPARFSQIWEFEGDSAKAISDGQLVYIDAHGNIMRHITPVEVDTPEILVDAIPVPDLNDAAEIVKEEHFFSSKKRKSSRFKGHLRGVDVGYNGYLNSSGSTVLPDDYKFLNLYGSKSAAVAIHLFQVDFALEPSKQVGIVMAPGIEFNNYRFDHNQVLKVVDGQLTAEDAGKNLKKNKLTTMHVDVPLLMEFQPVLKNGERNFYISGGLVGGALLRAHTKIVYQQDGDEQKDKERGSFRLNQFRYGVMGRIGYKHINLYGAYYVTPMFKSGNEPELHPYSVGFSFLFN